VAGYGRPGPPAGLPERDRYVPALPYRQIALKYSFRGPIAWRGGRRKGSRLAARAARQRDPGQDSSAPVWHLRLRFPDAHPQLSDLDTQARRDTPLAAATSRLPTSISAASATTGWNHQDISRYRDYYSFPGADTARGGSAHVCQDHGGVELAAVHFRKLGTSYLYCNWVRLSPVQFGSIDGNRRRGPAAAPCTGKWRCATGFPDSVPFSFLRSTFSLGYAVARGTRGSAAVKSWCR